jgi:hypothetical protein
MEYKNETKRFGAGPPRSLLGAPKNPKHLLFSPPPAAGFFPLHKGRRASRAALRAAQENWNPAKCLEKGLKTIISRGKTVRNAQKVLKNASAIPDFAPGDARGGPQCRGNARKRPPKPPIWRKKVPWSSAFSAGIPQRPLPAQVTGGAASKKPKTQQNYSVFPINELFSFRHHTDGVWMSASSC